MTRTLPNRRGFSVLIGITIFGLAISTGLPAFERVRSAGWPTWLAALVVPFSFLVWTAYLIGVPYFAYRIFRLLGWVSDEHGLSVRYGKFMVALWFAGIPILIYLAANAANSLLR